MRSKNEKDNLPTATLTDGGDDSGRAAADRGAMVATMEQYLTNWPTQHMTAITARVYITPFLPDRTVTKQNAVWRKYERSDQYRRGRIRVVGRRAVGVLSAGATGKPRRSLSGPA